MQNPDDTLVVNNKKDQYSPSQNTNDDPLARAFEELGRAVYTYRFEEPTPELIPFFDRITMLKNGYDRRQASSFNGSANQNPAGNGFNPQGFPNNPGFQSFNNAGSNFAQQNICPRCGAANSRDAGFCGKCGQRLR